MLMETKTDASAGCVDDALVLAVPPGKETWRNTRGKLF